MRGFYHTLKLQQCGQCFTSYDAKTQVKLTELALYCANQQSPLNESCNLYPIYLVACLLKHSALVGCNRGEAHLCEGAPHPVLQKP